MCYECFLFVLNHSITEKANTGLCKIWISFSRNIIISSKRTSWPDWVHCNDITDKIKICFSTAEIVLRHQRLHFTFWQQSVVLYNSSNNSYGASFVRSDEVGTRKKSLFVRECALLVFEFFLLSVLPVILCRPVIPIKPS